jgi:cyanophycinase
MTGVVALIGGGEFTDAVGIDRRLLEAAQADHVLVLPTAAAFEHPQRAVDAAVAWFARLGAAAAGLPVLGRPDASVPDYVDAVRAARFVYLTGGSPMHLRSVLKATPLWDALVAAHEDGAVVAASSAAAMVLTDPMVDPRGGAFTLGLGLVPRLAVVPQAEQWSPDRLHRTLALAGTIPVVTLQTGAAVLRDGDKQWSADGAVTVHLNGKEADLSALPG